MKLKRQPYKSGILSKNWTTESLVVGFIFKTMPILEISSGTRVHNAKFERKPAEKKPKAEK